MKIYGVVDNDRWGLVGASNDLSKILNEPFSYSQLHLECNNGNFSNAFSIFLYLLRSKKGCVLLWSTGLCFLLSFFLRIKGHHVVYCYHEPATMFQRIKKAESLIKGIATSILIFFTTKFIHECIVFNEKNKGYGRFLHLPYVPQFNKPKPCEKNIILFLGARLKSRSYEKFKSLEEKGFKKITFPSEEYGHTEFQKKSIFSVNNVIVWNIFNTPYNQSGVTVDCFKYGVPMLASKYESEISELTSSFLVNTSIKENLNNQIQQLFGEYDRAQTNAKSFSLGRYHELSFQWNSFFCDVRMRSNAFF
jgi:hypothetical protein